MHNFDAKIVQREQLYIFIRILDHFALSNLLYDLNIMIAFDGDLVCPKQKVT